MLTVRVQRLRVIRNVRVNRLTRWVYRPLSVRGRLLIARRRNSWLVVSWTGLIGYLVTRVWVTGVLGTSRIRRWRLITWVVRWLATWVVGWLTTRVVGWLITWVIRRLATRVVRWLTARVVRRITRMIVLLASGRTWTTRVGVLLLTGSIRWVTRVVRLLVARVIRLVITGIVRVLGLLTVRVVRVLAGIVSWWSAVR